MARRLSAADADPMDVNGNAEPITVAAKSFMASRRDVLSVIFCFLRMGYGGIDTRKPRHGHPQSCPPRRRSARGAFRPPCRRLAFVKLASSAARRGIDTGRRRWM